MEQTTLGDEVPEPHLRAIDAGAAAPSSPGWFRVHVGDCVHAGPGEKVVPLLQQRSDHLPAGVVRVGDEQNLPLAQPGHPEEEIDQPVAM